MYSGFATEENRFQSHLDVSEFFNGDNEEDFLCMFKKGISGRGDISLLIDEK